VAGVPLVCLSDSRMLFVFVSGKAFVPAFQRGGRGRESRRAEIQCSRAGWCYVYCGGEGGAPILAFRFQIA
jgi:hypothetical protein